MTQNVQELPTNAESINARERDRRWVPPGRDIWKINVDAAFLEKDLGVHGALWFVMIIPEQSWQVLVELRW